ncbi:MAG: ribosome silencing factor [Bryobacterales bacterium]|nr:ribosome silencing factor [Bryobacterales bacterium]
MHDCSRIPLRSGQLRRAADSETELWLAAVRAAESKKAADIRVLDLRDVASFTDYFVIASGANPRQIQAISDEVALRLKSQGVLPLNLEGYQNAEWILADYGDFIVHVFSERTRAYYDLERLWRQAKVVAVPAA